MMKNKERDLFLAGERWTISIVDSHDSNLVCEGDVSRGCTWPGKHAIYLSNELDERTFRRVLTHELTHAFLFATQIEEFETFNEEQVCELVAIWGPEIIKTTNMLLNWGLEYDSKEM